MPIQNLILAGAYEQAGLPDKAKEAYQEIIDFEREKLAEQEAFFSQRKTRPPRLEMGPMSRIAQERIERLKVNKG